MMYKGSSLIFNVKINLIIHDYLPLKIKAKIPYMWYVVCELDANANANANVKANTNAANELVPLPMGVNVNAIELNRGC